MWNHVEFRYRDKHPKKGTEPKFLDVCDETFASMPKCGYYDQGNFKTDEWNCVENEK